MYVLIYLLVNVCVVLEAYVSVCAYMHKTVRAHTRECTCFHTKMVVGEFACSLVDILFVLPTNLLLEY